MKEAWITLATNDDYAIGALVLGQSIRRCGTDRILHIIITPGVTEQIRRHLIRVFDDVSDVDPLNSKDESNLRLSQRPDLAVMFTKFHCWRLVQYSKCVFVDADCLMEKNCDDLFSYPEMSAAPDVGWPDMFNTGVFVMRPSYQTYDKLIKCAGKQGSFDGGDQGLLNEFFANWRTSQERRLPFTFNTSSSVSYTYISAYKKFSQDIRIVHYLGNKKPWHYKFNTLSSKVVNDSDGYLNVDHVRLWWVHFVDSVMPFLFHDPEQLHIGKYEENPADDPIKYYYDPPLPEHRQIEHHNQSINHHNLDQAQHHHHNEPHHEQQHISHGQHPWQHQHHYQRHVAVQYQQNAAPFHHHEHHQHYYPPHQPPAHKPAFVGAVTFNIEPAHLIFGAHGAAPPQHWAPPPQHWVPLTPRSAPYVEQPWQPPELPSFAGELPAIDRAPDAAPRLWPAAMADMVRGLDVEDVQATKILAEVARIVPHEMISLPLSKGIELPSTIYENRLTECPCCQYSFSFLNEYFPVKELEFEQAELIDVESILKVLPKTEIDEDFDYEDYEHRLSWEQGHVDYEGKDSWDNILHFLLQKLQ